MNRHTRYRAHRYSPPRGTLAFAMQELHDAKWRLIREVVRATRLDVAMLAIAKWMERRR